MKEYIFQLDQALFNPETGEAVFQPKVAGEIVRCRDCKHWYQDADTGMACEFTNLWQPEDGYCNWGDKKDDTT